MKKGIVAILAFLYLTVTSGVVVNVHYCMGRIATVDYGYKDESACTTCGMKEKKGCCHTEHSIVKLQDVHQQSLVQVAFNLLPTEIQDHFVASATTFDIQSFNFSLQYHSPPAQWANSLYLHNNVFKI